MTIGGFQSIAFQPAFQQVVASLDSGGGPDPRRYEWELFQARLFMRRQQEKLEAAKDQVRGEVSPVEPEARAVVAQVEKSEARLADLQDLERLVKAYSEPPPALATSSRKAYIEARSQADAAAYENLLRQLEAQQREEEQFLHMAAQLIFSLH